MLSETQVRNAKASDRLRKIFDSRGLYLQVMPNGGRYCRFDYVFNGKRKTLALGVYPDVTLATARRRHQDARERLAERMDPVVEKPKPEKTFEDVALQDLTASTFRDVVQKIERRGALHIAKRVLQTCGQVIRYAVVNDLVPTNPVAGVKSADIPKPHKKRNYPRVGAKELPALLHAIDGYVGSEHTRLALQLMSLTVVRTSELIGTPWSEFNLTERRWDTPSTTRCARAHNAPDFSGGIMRGIFRMDALPAQALMTGLISATQPDSGAAIQLAPAITAQQLLQSPMDAWITNGGGPTLPRKLDANQIRAVTITACNGMPRFREIYDVKQLRDVSEYLIRKVEAAN